MSIATLVLLGIAALLFRQTNIFWVAVFPGAIAVLGHLKNGARRGSDTIVPGGQTFNGLVQEFSSGKVYDVRIQDAKLEGDNIVAVSSLTYLANEALDYLKCTISVVGAVIQKIRSSIRILTPYSLLCSIFTGFIIWNQGVVLGQFICSDVILDANKR